MKRLIVFSIGLLMLGGILPAQNNREKRMFINEYVSPDELVSMSKSLTFDKAILLFSDFSKKYMNKIIVDVSNNKKPIGIDVENTYWYQAFENVLRENGNWYDEREEFFYVYSLRDSQIVTTTSGGVKVVGGVAVDSISKMLLKQRDIRISSVFFTVDVVKSLEAGINWSFFYSGDTTQAGARPTQFGTELYSGFTDPKASTGSGAVTATTGFFGRVVPSISFTNISALISFFSGNQLGDVLSGPSIVVSSGKVGRIQVGQDFYITTKDFAGNSVQQVQSAGIIINVKPTLYEENGIKFINMDIEAERSTVSGAGSSPIVNKSQAKTYSVLFDGEETVIGGLYTNSDVTDRGGVPFLKDLPWWVFGLKYIFGYEKITTSTQELIILMKAEVIPTIEERVAASAQKKGLNPIEQTRQQNAIEMERLKPKK